MLVYNLLGWVHTVSDRLVRPSQTRCLVSCFHARAQFSPAWNAVLRLEGGEVCRDCHHVVDAQFLHDAMHQRRRRSRAAAVLEKVELANDVISGAARDGGQSLLGLRSSSSPVWGS